MLNNILNPILGPILRPILNSDSIFINSFWGSNGRINCGGIYYCEQPIIC